MSWSGIGRRIYDILNVIGNRGHSGRMSRLLHDDSPLDTAPCARWLYRSRRTTLAMSARDTRMTSSRPPSLLRWRPFTYAAQGGRDWSRRQTQGGRHVAHPGGGRRPRGCEASEETAGNALESSWLRSGLYAPHSVAPRRVGRTLEPQSKRRIMGRAQFLTRHLQCHNHRYRKLRRVTEHIAARRERRTTVLSGMRSL